MATAHDTMAAQDTMAAHDTMAEASRRNMENFLDIITFWPGLFQKAANNMPTMDAKSLEARASSMDEVIDTFYEVPMQLMVAHRDVTKSCLAAARSFSYAMISAQREAKTTARTTAEKKS